MRVMITGFGPFGEHRANPSEMIARAIARYSFTGIQSFVRAPLPVLYRDAADAVIREVRARRIDAVFAIGLSSKSPHVRLERFARNHSSSEKPDVGGRVQCTGRILPGRPRLLSGIDPRPLSRALATSGIAHAFSSDPGGYVCNDFYYRLLAARVPTLFVHVPNDASARLARPLAIGIANAMRALVDSRL